MPNFLENIFDQLRRSSTRVVLREIHGEQFQNVTAAQLLSQIQQARESLRRHKLQPNARCAILAPNDTRWIAVDLALMAENAIVVPLYSRQAHAELAAVLQDCQPSLLILGDQSLGDAVAKSWPACNSSAPQQVLLDELLSASAPPATSLPVTPPNPRADSDLVTIVYTSGTSGEPKGVCLTTANVSFMLSRTTERLDQLMRGSQGPDSVFHYLPLNFAASWVATLSFLSRDSVVSLSTNLNQLADEIRIAAPHYFLNVPTLLERVRRGVDDAIAKRPGAIRSLYAKARDASARQLTGNEGARFSASCSPSNNDTARPNAQLLDGLWLALGRKLIFSKIKERFGPNLRALICGSAPLAPETQGFFQMLGIPVLQVYGLTETTGICTMDDPNGTVDTGHVGPTINGIEMRIAENEEIAVRGPNVFPGYWNRVEDTVKVLQDGWFHTGDQGEKNAHNNWRIIGRVKNLIILNSGHKIPPEPIEDKLAQLLPGAQHVVIVGNGRGYLCALVTGQIDAAVVQTALDTINPDLPHYRQIRNFTLLPDSFTLDSGLLTAMGKLRRSAINTRFAPEIAAMYAAKKN